MEALVRSLALEAAAAHDNRTAAAALLEDFVACCLAAPNPPNLAHAAKGGPVGLTACLALRACARDLDDIDWRSMHHPGSVVLPVAVALGWDLQATGDAFCRSIAAGYSAAALVADLFGPTHRALWHVTSTAGTAGAAVAASTLLELPAEQVSIALSLALATAGGVGQLSHERRGAASFGRAAAATRGLLAALCAADGVAGVLGAIDGERGVRRLMNLPAISEKVQVDPSAGLARVSLRTFPVNGFGQSAVAAASALRRQTRGDAEAIHVHLPSGVIPLVSGTSHGIWWDVRAAVRAAWQSGNALDLRVGSTADEIGPVVVLASDDRLSPGQCILDVTTERGRISSGVVEPPAADPTSPASQDLMRSKQERLFGLPRELAGDIARAMMVEGPEAGRGELSLEPT
jgi:hypothetical protein